ncbi:alpha/beta fold hydrolase [Cognaticolwellia aestuarii]|uniref:S9 family peptidase n=1 Tax=Cognaticolwellia aestuarii TaxID=329993 RepID=UPI0013015361|nr:alpha/beta fold hydrolase [Cognaticolwellia aestuarii]
MYLQTMKLIILLCLMFGCSLLVSAQVSNNVKNQKLDINVLFQDDDYRDVRLSPDGKHIALIQNQKDTPVLIVVDVETMKAINQISFANKDNVGSYSWANNERLLIFLSSKQRNKERKAYYGEIYSINIDEDEGRFIFGIRSLVSRGKIKKNVQSVDYEKHLAHPKIISILENDPEHIIISTSQYQDKGMWAFKLNIYSGKTETLAKVDDSNADHKSTKLHYFDTHQELWLSSKQENENNIIARYDFEDESWIEYPLINTSYNLSIISKYKDEDKLIVSDYCGNNTISICLFDPLNKELSPLYQVDGYDTNWLYFDKENTPYAVSYFDEYPQYKILNNNHTMAQQLSGFLERFAGYSVIVNWNSTDEKRALITLSSDIQPTVWYLFDSEKNKLTFVANSKKKINTEQLNPQYSFNFMARDNVPIQGYITLPAKTNKAPSPAVILVHGGPHARDYWGFDPAVQLLSSRGYAVVQVNYRGSTGFGWEFESSGFQQWGEKVQFDILDSIDHLVEKQYIDKNRLCIMGSSFGGYSAIQSSIIAPDLFKCSIATSGVYDIQLHVEDETPKEARALTKRIGLEEIQSNHSPINAIKNLKSPVLLVHGTKDDVADVKQAEALIKQLKKHNKQYQWFEIKNEGHYFYKPKNRITYYEKVIQFLNKYNPVN